MGIASSPAQITLPSLFESSREFLTATSSLITTVADGVDTTTGGRAEDDQGRPVNRMEYSGSFASNGEDISGTIESVSKYVEGELTFQLDQISADAGQFFQVLFDDDASVEDAASVIFSSDDTIVGSSGVDVLSGFGGQDILSGAGGPDVLDGGDGIDTGRFDGPQSAYTLTISGGSTSVQDRRQGGEDRDELRNIELLDFTGDADAVPFDLRAFGGLTGVNEADLKSFIELYIAYFNRAPDAVGLNFWGTAFKNGLTLEQAAAQFVGQPETLAAYPTGTSNQAFVETVYTNVLGRLPDQAGIDFWQGALTSGQVTRDQFILEILRGARSEYKLNEGQAFVDQQAADRAFLDNKVSIGTAFAIQNGMSDSGKAAAVMNTFNGSSPSFQSALQLVDTYFQEALDPNNGEFLMQLTEVFAGNVAFANTEVVVVPNTGPFVRFETSETFRSISEEPDGSAFENDVNFGTSGRLVVADLDVDASLRVIDVQQTSGGGFGSSFNIGFGPLSTNAFNEASFFWDYNVDDSALDYLEAGEVATEAYAITFADEFGVTTGATVFIDLIGAADNAAPVLNGGSTVIVDSAATSFNLNSFTSSIEAGETITYQVLGVTNQSGGADGSVFIDSSGTLTFDTNGEFLSLDPGQSNFVDIEVQASDGSATDTSIFTVEVQGAHPLIPNASFEFGSGTDLSDWETIGNGLRVGGTFNTRSERIDAVDGSTYAMLSSRPGTNPSEVASFLGLSLSELQTISDVTLNDGSAIKTTVENVAAGDTLSFDIAYTSLWIGESAKREPAFALTMNGSPQLIVDQRFTDSDRFFDWAGYQLTAPTGTQGTVEIGFAIFSDDALGSLLLVDDLQFI